MLAPTIRNFILMMLIGGSGGVASACYVEPLPPPAYADGYQPQFYDGYVVYYDDVGRPFYHVDGVAVWVPATSPLYIGLVNHWRAYRPAYGRWYANHGYRYRDYHGRH